MNEQINKNPRDKKTKQTKKNQPDTLEYMIRNITNSPFWRG